MYSDTYSLRALLLFKLVEAVGVGVVLLLLP